MKFSDYKYLVLSDLYRMTADTRLVTFIKYLFFNNEYKYVFWLRTCRYCKSSRILKWTLFPLTRYKLYRLSVRLGISIRPLTEIGPGLNINHIGGIVVNGKSIIGKNCTISHGVTLGQKNRGKYQGCPILGSNVYIGPGAKIIGAVKIGSNVAIGANSVVTKDIPDNSVVVGIPGRVISQEGASGYAVNIEYDDVIGQCG